MISHLQASWGWLPWGARLYTYQSNCVCLLCSWRKRRRQIRFQLNWTASKTETPVDFAFYRCLLLVRSSSIACGLESGRAAAWDFYLMVAVILQSWGKMWVVPPTCCQERRVSAGFTFLAATVRHDDLHQAYFKGGALSHHPLPPSRLRRGYSK